MPKTMYVEKSVVINKDVREVFDCVKYSKNQEKFSVWNLRDPDQKISQTGNDGEVGHTYSWDSQMESVGAGTQTLSNIVQDQEIHYDIAFQRPMPSNAKSIIKVDKLHDDQSKVTWSMESPMDDSMADGIDQIQNEVGAEIDESLQNLKKMLEG